jgi:pyruvate kinase
MDMVTRGMSNTKILVTLGPASDSPAVLSELMAAGVSVFRLNASHGSQQEHAARIAAIRDIAAKEDRRVAILFDLQGPKIRLGKCESEQCRIPTGAEFTITTEPVIGNSELASTTYAKFAQDVRPGDRVLLADGAVELRAIASNGVFVNFHVVTGGIVGSNKGINLPGVKVSAPSLTEKDMSDLEFALGSGVDLIALSFVRTASDVCALRRRIGRRPAKVMAKIEKPAAWDHIEEILDEADGVMVARGDLGVEMALECVPPIQKSIIRRARRRGKFVITATQMLESMIEKPTPTRAEVSDVANAIYDGTDAVMLSAETSVGKFPVEAAAYMVRIAAEAEASINKRGFQEPSASSDPTHAEIVADAAYHAARAARVSAIVVFTSSGSSARLVSRYRPPVPIYAITPSDTVARQLLIHYGVFPVLAPQVGSTDEMLAQMDRLLIDRGYLRVGDVVVFVAGQPIGRPGNTNLMKLHQIGDLR